VKLILTEIPFALLASFVRREQSVKKVKQQELAIWHNARVNLTNVSFWPQYAIRKLAYAFQFPVQILTIVKQMSVQMVYAPFVIAHRCQEKSVQLMTMIPILVNLQEFALNKKIVAFLVEPWLQLLSQHAFWEFLF
jgi:hypothetical protein